MDRKIVWWNPLVYVIPVSQPHIDGWTERHIYVHTPIVSYYVQMLGSQT